MGLGFRGPCTQYLGTWDLGNSHSSTGSGQVYGYWVLGPLGFSKSRANVRV